MAQLSKQTCPCCGATSVVDLAETVVGLQRRPVNHLHSEWWESHAPACADALAHYLEHSASDDW